MTTLNKKIEILNRYGIIPSGLNIPIEIKITDIRASSYQYHGNKYAESHESYENNLLSIKFQHSKVDTPFWITIFEGATYREESTNCIIATFEETINSNFEISMANGVVEKADCLTNDSGTDGLESIKELLAAFEYRLYESDESGLYDYGNGPLRDDNADFLRDSIDELIDTSFVTINEKISLENPDFSVIAEIQKSIEKITKGLAHEL